MYLVFKVVHVLAVVVFLGNITVGIFWKDIADRTKSPAIIAHTIDGIIRADRIFTIPGVILVIVGGVGAAVAGHIPILATGWLLWGISLFVLSGLAFGPLSRTQRRMLALAREGEAKGQLDWLGWERLSQRWNLYGMTALIPPFIAAILMILKPVLPAFHAQ